MQKRTVGTIVSAKKQWWLKVNTKAIRKGKKAMVVEGKHESNSERAFRRSDFSVHR